MATDGVKIIDGDCAHDTYWGIMDLYDSGADLTIIEKEFPLIQQEYIDEFDNEIYVTSCGLAYWEVGLMTSEKLDYIKKVIDKGTCIKEWTQIEIKLGKAREKELEKYWQRISQSNSKIRQRKKYRKITNFYFQPDDLLTFKLNDCNYRAVVCANIDQYRGRCNYILVPTTYNSPTKPKIDDIYDKEILGHQIGSGYPQEETKNLQPGIERIWKFTGGVCNFLFGVVALAVDHKDFINFKDRFERVGTLKISDGLKATGSFGYLTDFERFEDIFSDLDKQIKVFNHKAYPVRLICEI